MKASDSTSSLAELNTGDPACFFCAEVADPEKGGALVGSRTFSSCACRYSVHSDCWNDYLRGTTAGERPVCPSCKKDVLPLRILEIHTTNPNKKDRTVCILALAFLAVAAIIALVTYSMLKK